MRAHHLGKLGLGVVAVGLLTGCGDGAADPGSPGTPRSRGAASIDLLIYDSQSAEPGQPVGLEPHVRVSDQRDSSVVGLEVRFTVAAGGGRVVKAADTTNGFGRATSGAWTLGPAVGTNLLLVSAGGVQARLHAFGVGLHAVALSSRYSAACAIKRDRRVVCWGYNSAGQLGNGSFENSSRPVPIAAPDVQFATVSAGSLNACAVGDGDAYCWGGVGYIGDGSVSVNRPVPVRIELPAPVESISASGLLTCAVLRDESAWCWGDNRYGQVGNGVSGGVSYSPARVSGGLRFRSISTSWSHACALSDIGAASCWGRNLFGQLGDGTREDRPVPTAVLRGMTFRSIVVGGNFTCALTVTEEVYCWGFADSIGDGNVSDRLVPTRVNLPRGVTQLTAGSSLACALDAKGQAYCWGYDELGALGDWHRLYLRSPIQVAAGFRWQRVSVSDASFCGIAAGASDVGQVYCQGRNIFGQLGIGTRLQSYPPLGVLP